METVEQKIEARKGQTPRCGYCQGKMRGWRATDWKAGFDPLCSRCEKLGYSPGGD